MKANSKTTLTTLASMTVLAASLASVPAHAAEFRDHARVISVAPQYERVNQPRQECYDEYRPDSGHRTDRSYGGAVVGGVAGAIVGNQVGRGHGREAATAVGAITGAIVGDRIQQDSRRDQDSGDTIRRCRDIDNWENRITGYRVEYEYAGRRYVTEMPNDPGRELGVRVSVEPY